jgi:cell division protein FtsI/penicillin-binding protein 2
LTLPAWPGAAYDPAMGTRRALSGAVWVFVLALLAACQPRPAPEGAAHAYLEAWERADYGAMYALVDGATRGRVSASAFAARYQAAAGAAGLRAVRASLGPRTDLDGDHARFPVAARWDTTRVGAFAQDLSLSLVHEDGRWAVQWQPDLLLAGLGADDRLEYREEPAPRGAIVDRAGRPLVPAGVERRYPEGPLAAHVLGYVRQTSVPVEGGPGTERDPGGPDAGRATGDRAGEPPGGSTARGESYDVVSEPDKACGADGQPVLAGPTGSFNGASCGYAERDAWSDAACLAPRVGDMLAASTERRNCQHWLRSLAAPIARQSTSVRSARSPSDPARYRASMSFTRHQDCPSAQQSQGACQPFMAVDVWDATAATGAAIGQAGLERWGDDFLQGTPGGRLVVVAPDGAERATVAAQEPRVGATLALTLDVPLQRRAEALLDGRVGAVVALDPRDGAIRALASRPTFVPADWSEEATDRWAADASMPVAARNRATESTYPAASLFKVVAMAAGLETGEYDPATPFRCSGAWTGLGGREALEDSVAGGHGRLTLTEGLIQSCNVVFYEMGKRLNTIDPHLLPAVARAFGLGAPTGLVGLDEAPGAVPDPRTREARGEAWAPWDAVELAIGHGGLEATPLQLARLYAALATDGVLRPPVLVRQAVAPDGRVLYAAPDEAQGVLPLSDAHRAAIQEAMRGVVADPRGTAATAFRGFAIPTAGKTGSAESDGPLLHAWFAGYAPAAAPELVVVALVEQGGGGGQAAAPIARGVLEAYFDGAAP